MKKKLIFLISLISTSVMAQSSNRRAECLKAMAVFEFSYPIESTKDLRNHQGSRGPVVPVIIDGQISKYDWNVATETVVIRKQSPNNKETVWSPRLFIEDGDGRTKVPSLKDSKISDRDLEKIQNWFLANSGVAKYLVLPKEKYLSGEMLSLDKAYAECEGVTGIQLPDKKIELGDAVVKARHQLREKFPEAFKSPTSATGNSGTR